jgi:hypothetical protein
MNRSYQLSEEAAAYACRQILSRAGLNCKIPPVSFSYGDRLCPSTDKPQIIVRPCAPKAFKTLLGQEKVKLCWLPSKETVPLGMRLPFDDQLPVPFWGKGIEEGSQPFAQLGPDNSVIFNADIIACTFFFLSRWEETVIDTRDEHQRFPALASFAFKNNFIDRPIVDEYALILNRWLQLLLPNWRPRPNKFSIKISHDIDYVRRIPGRINGMRKVGADLLKHRNPKQAWRTAIDNMKDIFYPRSAPYFRRIYYLADLAREHGLKNSFYFMTAKPNRLNSDYNVTSSLLRRCIYDLVHRGFEIGLHTSYQACCNSDKLLAEKLKLDELLGKSDCGGRQHFLRFKVPDTWRNYEKAGLVHDATMGYADHEGFRCGTCHPFRPFDIEKNREMTIWELPLIVMDATLRQYRKLTPAQGEAQILRLAEKCKRVGGIFTLLWHNSSLDGEWGQWQDIYQRVVSVLSSEMI